MSFSESPLSFLGSNGSGLIGHAPVAGGACALSCGETAPNTVAPNIPKRTSRLCIGGLLSRVFRCFMNWHSPSTVFQIQRRNNNHIEKCRRHDTPKNHDRHGLLNLLTRLSDTQCK